MPRDIQHISTSFGDIAYTEAGAGPPALFVHGVFLNGYLWRNVIPHVSDLRRCITVDLLGHGATQAAPDQDVSWPAQAEMLAAFCDALGLETIDLVGNDSGGGIAQIFAARHGERLRSLTLTDCDVSTNCPPPALQPLVDACKQGTLGVLGQQMLVNPAIARQVLGVGYQYPEQLTEETIRTYLDPLFGTPEHTQQFVQLFDQWFVHMDGSLVTIEPALRALQTPTLIVWGTADVFFGVEWAEWLRDTIPGTREYILLDGAKLFFPEERPAELIEPLRRHWANTTQS